MTTTQQWLTILIVVLGTMTTRFLPFLVFPASKEPPAFIDFLGKVLPSAVMGLLVVYAYKDYLIQYNATNLPAFIASILLIILYLWRKNMLLSISIGTIAYMVMVQLFI